MSHRTYLSVKYSRGWNNFSPLQSKFGNSAIKGILGACLRAIFSPPSPMKSRVQLSCSTHIAHLPSTHLLSLPHVRYWVGIAYTVIGYEKINNSDLLPHPYTPSPSFASLALITPVLSSLLNWRKL